MTETDKPWPENLAALVGKQVERYRREQGLYGDKLAARCTALGFKLDKHGVSKLETGARKSVTVGELLVLAAALGVPPLALLLPMQESDAAELMPAASMSLDMALDWLEGAGPVPGPPGAEEAPDGYRPARQRLADLRRHARLMWEARDARIGLKGLEVAQRIEAGASDYEPSITLAERAVQRADEALIEHRAYMRRSGWAVLPRLGRDLEGIEDVTADA